MAFRTNKVPAIEERTVSGSSVSFNSAFALPLKACKVSFSATRAGSGDPSPSNPRAISGVSAIGLTANSTPVSVNFDDTYYGGELDVVNKKAIIDRSFIVFDGSEDEQWGNYPNGFFIRISDIPLDADNSKGLSNMLKVGVDSTKTGISFGKSVAATYFFHITDNSTLFPTVTDRDTWRAFLNNNNLQLVYPLATPIEIDLSSIPDLSTILGNNTFSTDTGTLEITFADLQEKSASGAVATFNTALAMPLLSCNIAVNAWQEGSGDPSPDNVRNIVGYNALNIYKRGINLWDEQWEIGGYYNDTGLPRPLTDRIRCKNAIPIKQNTKIYTPFSMAFLFYDINNNVLPSVSRVGYSRADNMYLRQSSNTEGEFLIPQGAYYMRFYLQASYGTTYNNDISINYPSTDKDYHAYNGETVTVALGQDVYGGVYNSVTGKLTINKVKVIYDGSSDENWYLNGSYGVYMLVPTNYRVRDISVNKYKFVTNKTSGSVLSNNECCLNADMTSFLIKDNDALTVSAFKSALSNINMEVIFSLVEPFEIQLDPTLIETYDGSNNIFCDTGDTSLVYKDLDIAKRGNFREVFKLPS